MTVAGARPQLPALRSWAAPAAVGLVALGVALSTVSPYLVGAFQDDAIYVILGRALATGAGYRYVHLPGAPAATHYPPGYPAFLSLLWRLAPNFPGNVVTFERADAVLLAIAAVLGFELARRRAGLSATWSAVVALGGTITILPLAFASMVLSESLFLVALLIALLGAEWIADGGEARRAGAPAPEKVDVQKVESRRAVYGQAAAVGVLCGCVALVRSIGIVLVPAALVVCAWRGRRAAAVAVAVGAAAVLLPWQLWVWVHTRELAPILQGEYGPYSSWVVAAIRRRGLGFAMRTFTGNSVDMGLTLGAIQATRLPAAVRWVTVAAWLALLALGMERLARRAAVTVLFVLLYTAAVLLWPFPPQRFISAIWVLVMMALVAGVEALARWRPDSHAGTRLRRAAIAVAVLLGAGTVRYNVLGYQHRWWGSIRERLSTKVAQPLAWLTAHPTLPAPTMSAVEPMLYLYADRPGLPCTPFTADNYVYPRDTGQDRATLEAALHRHRVGSIIATDPVCALAAIRLASEPAPLLVAVDTTTAGLAVFVRTPHD